MVKINGAIIGAATLMAGSALASDFNNNLQSPIIVSPSQLHQVQGSRTDFGITVDSATDSIGDTDIDSDSFGIVGTGVYSINEQVKIGTDIGFTDAEVKDFATTQAMTIAPVVTFSPMSELTFGLQYNYTSLTTEPDADGAEDLTGTLSNVVLGGTWAANMMEAGLVITTAETATDDFDTDSEADDMPMMYTLHGRYRMTDTFAAGLIYDWTRYSELDLEGDASFDDASMIRATAEFMAGPVGIEGTLGYQTAWYGDDALASSESISLMAMTVGADYMINQTASVGGMVDYEIGSESVNDVDYERNALGMMVRGNVRF